MNSYTFDRADALLLYKEASKAGKALLDKKFGKETFNSDPVDKILTFEDACEANGVSPVDIIPFKKPLNADQASVNAFAKLVQIIRAFNEGQVPDWKNSNQYKYYPWWKMDGTSGSGLSYDDYDGGHSYADVASRLCLLKSEHVAIVAKRFLSLYEEYMTQG